MALITWSLATGLFPTLHGELDTATHWWMGLAGAIGLFVSVLLHELGHALVARRFDVPMRGITLFIFGGVAEMTREPPHPRAEVYVAVGGPAVTAVLVGVFYAVALAPLPPAIVGIFEYLMLLNIVLLLFNAVPAFPLDGGRVLRGVLWHVKGSLSKATATSARIGRGFGALLIVLAVLQLFAGNPIGAVWWFLLGLFLRYAAGMSYQQVVISRELKGEPVREFMTKEPVTVTPDTTIERFVEDYVYQHHFKLFPVTQGGQLVGCVTTRQVKEVPRDQWSDKTVGEVSQSCSSDNALRPDDDAMDALQQLQRSGSSRAMVIDGDQLVGVLSLKDLMKTLSLKLEMESDESPAAARAAAG